MHQCSEVQSTIEMFYDISVVLYSEAVTLIHCDRNTNQCLLLYEQILQAEFEGNGDLQ